MRMTPQPSGIGFAVVSWIEGGDPPAVRVSVPGLCWTGPVGGRTEVEPPALAALSAWRV